jgi:hypothetical protein
MGRRLALAFGLALLASLIAYFWLTRLEGFDTQGADDPNMIYRDSIRWFGDAIAGAEGFGVLAAIPTRANNPGDLVMPNWSGRTLGNAGVSVFVSPAEGWRRLYFQLQLIADDKSRVYSRSMSVREMASKWTTTDQEAWTQNVVNRLQSKWAYGMVTPETAIGDLLS